MDNFLPPELTVETEIFNYLKEELSGEVFPGYEGEKELFFAQGFIPKLDYGDKLTANGVVNLAARVGGGETTADYQLKKTIPLCLVKNTEDEQTLDGGYYDGTVKMEVIVAVYDPSPTGYQSAHKLAYKVKEKLLSTPHMKGRFSLKPELGFKGKLMPEESGGDFWFYRMEFKAFMGVIKPDPLF